MAQDFDGTFHDLWSDWLFHYRNGNDAGYLKSIQTATAGYAERVLDGGKLATGMTLVDVGCGDGLVGLRAIERIGSDLQVIMTDISRPLLDYAKQQAEARGVSVQCHFIECAADHLGDIPDGSVDLVCTRAVLAYVADRAAAMREFLRILKPGGRLSVAEPLFRDEALAVMSLRKLLDRPALAPHQTPDPFLPLLHRWKAAQFPDTEERMAQTPITNYSERDLLQLVQSCGFTRPHLELHIDIQPSEVPSWEVFLEIAPHPQAPSLKTILAERFTADERALLERVVRSHLEAGQSVNVDRVVYLTAIKPG